LKKILDDPVLNVLHRVMVNPVANILTEKLCISVSAMDQDCPNEVFVVDKVIVRCLKSGIFYSRWTECADRRLTCWKVFMFYFSSKIKQSASVLPNFLLKKNSIVVCPM